METTSLSPGLIIVSVLMFFASYVYGHYAHVVMKKPVTMFTSSSIPRIIAWKILTMAGCGCGFFATLLLGPLVLALHVLRLYEVETEVPTTLMTQLFRVNLFKIGGILFVASWVCMIAAHFVGAKPLKKM